jgi:hypothetical protein
MFKKLSPPFLGFLQSTGLVIYVSLVSYFFTLGPLFSKRSDASFYAPIIMLLLFILSAVVSATLFLGKAGVFFWEKKYKESFTLLGWTVGWGFFYFFLVLLFFIYLPS